MNALPTTTTLAFYHDGDKTQFPSVYHDSSLSCQQKLDEAGVVVDPAKLSTGVPVKFKVSGLRPRWRWVAAVDCTTNSVIIYNYNITFSNTQEPVVLRQFSYDQNAVLWVTLVGIIVSTVLLAVASIWWRRLITLNLRYEVMRLLVITISIKLAAYVLELIHLAVYSHDGIGIPFLDYVSQVVDLAAIQTFMLLIFLVANGWSVTYSQFKEVPALIILIGVWGVISAVSFACLVWNFTTFDPTSTLYMYESNPGYVILAFRLAGLVFLLISIALTLKYHSKGLAGGVKRVIMIFGGSYALWFLILPVMVLLAHFLMSWVRVSVVSIVLLCIDMVSFVGLLVIFKPNKHNRFVSLTDDSFGDAQLQSVSAKAMSPPTSPLPTLPLGNGHA